VNTTSLVSTAALLVWWR